MQVKQKYEKRLAGNFDIEGISPGYDTYVLLKSKVKITVPCDESIQQTSLLIIQVQIQ